MTGGIDDVGELAVVDHGAAGFEATSSPKARHTALQLRQPAGQVEPVVDPLEALLLVEGVEIASTDVPGVGVDGHQLHPLRASPPRTLSVILNSWAMIGQSEVQTGSRNVRAIALPCRLSSDTARPCWSTRSKARGRACWWPCMLPSTAWLMIGSALGSLAATAMGAAPIRVIPTAPVPRRSGRRRSDRLPSAAATRFGDGAGGDIRHGHVAPAGAG